MKPKPHEYPTYYAPYIARIENENLRQELKESGEILRHFFGTLSPAQKDYRYAEGKWTIAEVIQHVIDSERVFAYRALRFSRNDRTALPGFDQDSYVPESGAPTRSLESLCEEFASVRNATLSLFDGFSDEMLLRSGEANGYPQSVRAIGFIISGHGRHHLAILRERYLPK